ncbi:MAG: hypothetical protein ACJ749_08980 [Flavisolibacter sp.]
MKKLKASAFSVLLIVCFQYTEAQEQKIPFNEPNRNKPKLFNNLPQKMNLKISEVEPVLQQSIGTSVNLKLADNFLFQGTVISKSDTPDESVKSIVIRSASMQGASFTFSKTKNQDGSFKYIGRIMSRNNGDAYEIKFENGQYILEKKNLYELIAE